MSTDSTDNGSTAVYDASEQGEAARHAEAEQQREARDRERAAKIAAATLATDPAGTTYELVADGSVVATFPSNTKQVRAPAGAKFLTKRDIVSADDSGYEDVEVPEWGGWVRVKRLTAKERGQIEAASVKVGRDGETKYDGSNLRELFCQAAVVDPASGTRLFSMNELHLLSSKSAAALDRVYESATRQARVSKRDMDELAGESDAAQ